jgi:hypothetical protein
MKNLNKNKIKKYNNCKKYQYLNIKNYYKFSFDWQKFIVKHLYKYIFSYQHQYYKSCSIIWKYKIVIMLTLQIFKNCKIYYVIVKNYNHVHASILQP